MDYKLELKEYLSKCSGKVVNVFYEVYQIISSVEESSQADAIMCLVGFLGNIDSDGSHKAKDYYTEAQLDRVNQKFSKKKLDEFIYEQATAASHAGIQPIDFYRNIWNDIKNSFCRTEKECALALFKLMDNDLIPYRNVGVGISMSNTEYKAAAKKIRNTVFDDTKYILNLYYEQKTQRASLLVDKLLSLEDKQLQAVYMTMIINEVEENIKDQLKDYIDNM